MCCPRAQHSDQAIDITLVKCAQYNVVMELSDERLIFAVLYDLSADVC